MKVLASNRKAYFNFEVLDKFEAGIMLYGWEVKSIKAGRISLNGAYIKFKNLEAFLSGVSITKLQTSTILSSGALKNTDSDKKLLLNKKEIVKISTLAKMKGSTVVPLEIYQNDRGIIKVEIALVKGKKLFDKRQKLKEMDEKRRIDADRKRYNV